MTRVEQSVESIFDALCKESKKVNRRLNVKEFKGVLLSVLESRHGTSTKAKAEAYSEQVETIRKAFPRLVQPAPARAAIRKAIDLHGYEHVFERTKLFRRHYKGWSKSQRDYCPLPSTWFNQERYDDDEKEWAGKDNRYVQPEAEKVSKPPPNDWQRRVCAKYPTYEPYRSGVKQVGGEISTYKTWEQLKEYGIHEEIR